MPPRSSLSNHAFSMAITAWAAKFLTKSICFSVKGFVFWRNRKTQPISSSSFNIGTTKIVRTPPSSTAATTAELFFFAVKLICSQVGDVNEFSSRSQAAKKGIWSRADNR